MAIVEFDIQDDTKDQERDRQEREDYEDEGIPAAPVVIHELLLNGLIDEMVSEHSQDKIG